MSRTLGISNDRGDAASMAPGGLWNQRVRFYRIGIRRVRCPPAPELGAVRSR